MTSVQSFFKNNLHKSMLPTQNYNLNSQSPLQMRRSVMDPRMTQTEIKSNNISYKYERVGNIFKLVEAKNQIKSNKSNKSNNSDPKQQTIQQNYQIQKINDALQELTNRIISLELQQAKIPGFERKLNEGLIQINTYESLNQHFYDKIKNVSKQILDIKQRLEQVEEHGGSYQTHFKNIYNQITETKENNVYVEKKFQYMHQKLMSEIHNQITTMKNKLSTHQNNPQKNQKKQQKQLLIKKIKSNDMKPKVYVLKYRQTYQYQQSVYSVNEIKYLVDREGRLLDSSGYVILDSNNKQIKLNEKHLLKLNDFGILA